MGMGNRHPSQAPPLDLNPPPSSYSSQMLAPSVCLRGELSLGAKPGDGAQPEGKAGKWGSAWGQSREMGLSLGAKFGERDSAWGLREQEGKGHHWE